MCLQTNKENLLPLNKTKKNKSPLKNFEEASWYTKMYSLEEEELKTVKSKKRNEKQTGWFVSGV